jgi:hypothetical protein
MKYKLLEYSITYLRNKINLVHIVKRCSVFPFFEISDEPENHSGVVRSMCEEPFLIFNNSTAM